MDEANYDVKEGSTIVTFKSSFLETLSVGKHPVEIVSASGSAHGMIEIKAQVDPEKVQVTKSNDSTTKSSDATPKTGENSGIYLWSSFIFVAAGGILLVLRKKKSRQRD